MQASEESLVKLLAYYAAVVNINTYISVDQENFRGSLSLIQAYVTVTRTEVTSLWAQLACNENRVNTCFFNQHFILNRIGVAQWSFYAFTRLPNIGSAVGKYRL
jgi:hypothetical protein